MGNPTDVGIAVVSTVAAGVAFVMAIVAEVQNRRLRRRLDELRAVKTAEVVSDVLDKLGTNVQRDRYAPPGVVYITRPREVPRA